ncbi:hypothetical protein [Ligilactobacillus faecis]|uniref:hypothetical protein n=1 Tax=Ligilactobacillus faecis TaxID=762833 RepID=UPI002469BCFD|nr:hypothetical protein [Ligilactobacillus faecis]WGN89574.1 hypothetical protein QFX10_00245 [Ligilactobacillus faecis]
MFIGSSIKKIKDNDFLRVKWGSKDNIIKEAVAQLNEQAQSRTDNKIKSSYPKYLTFLQAESLFQMIQQLTEDREPIVIEKLELVHQENGKPTSNHEAYATKIRLDDNYICLLEPLLIAVFSNKDRGFEKATYEEKCDYFAESIFQSYIDSVGIDPKYLPLLPSEASVTEAIENKQDIEIGFDYEFPLLITEIDGEELTEETSEGDVAEFFNSEIESNEAMESVNNIVEQTTDPFDYQPEMLGTNTKITEAEPPKPTMMKDPQPITDQKENSDIQTDSSELQLDFPLFDLKEFSKANYAPYEDEYVEWKLNEFKREANQYLLQRCQVATRYSNDVIKDKLARFENAEYLKIKQEIDAKDDRANLKNKIVKETKASELQELEQQENLLDKERLSALEQEKQRHQAKNREIETDFESRKHALKHDLHQKFFIQADQRYKEELLAANGQLERMLQSRLNDLEIRKLAKKESLIDQAKQETDNIGRQLFDSKKAKLERLKPLILHEYRQAKKEYLIKQAQELRQKEREDTLKTNEQLRDQVKELLDSNAKAKENNYETQKQLIEEKKRSLQEQADSLLKIKDALHSESSKKEPIEEQKNKSKNWLWPTVIIVNLMILFGGFTVYQQQTSQKQRTALQEALSKQQKNITELKRQQASLKAKEKSSRESKSSEENNKRRMSEMEKELNELRGSQAENSDITKAEETK